MTHTAEKTNDKKKNFHKNQPQKSTLPCPPKKSGIKRIQVKHSDVHGKGVFALTLIPEDSKIIEYKGKIITWEEAQDLHPHDPNDPYHTFYFGLDDGIHVIDGGQHGNAARWINHACEPNCQAVEQNGRVYIYALQDIAAKEELTYDYSLTLDMKYTKKLKAHYKCLCGAPNCRGTMLAPKD